MMSILRSFISWWAARRLKPMNQMLSVEYGDLEVRVRVIERMDASWNQDFLWKDIRRVCFKDAGLYSSDIIFVELWGRDTPVAVLTEAKGGAGFVGALTERGYFPEAVWRKAMGETGGALHCWPPRG